MKKINFLLIFFILLFSFNLVVSAETHEFYNILNVRNTKNIGSVNGVVFTKNMEGYVANGVCTADSYVLFAQLSLSKGRYFLYSGNSNIFVIAVSGVIVVDSSNGYITFDTNGGIYNFYFLISKGVTYNQLSLNPEMFLFDYKTYSSSSEFLSTGEKVSNAYNEGYSQGKLDGVSEYKSSEEYSAALSNERELGASEGYQNGKSDGYALGAKSGERVGYINGYKSGYENFKVSAEYKHLLQNEFDEGFDNGVASAVDEKSENNFMQIGIPILLVCAELLIALLILKSKKRKRYEK